MQETISSTSSSTFSNKKNFFIRVAAISVVIAASVLFFFSYFYQNSSKTRASLQNAAIFTPSIIPLDSSELINPNRGLYKWRGGEVVPVADGMTHANTSQDMYDRFTWNQLETTEGTYDFTIIETKANEAKARGGKFSLRVYMFCESYCDVVSVPSYIANDQPKYNGWYKLYKNKLDDPNDDRNVYVPDWNDEDFLRRWEALIAKLGERYNNDPRIDMIDITGYGNWGEGHMSCVYDVHLKSWCPQGQNQPTGLTDMTDASKRRIVNAYARSLGNKRLMAMQNDTVAVLHAMTLTNQTNPPVFKSIGWRNDCIGLHTASFNEPTPPGMSISPTPRKVTKVYEHFRKSVQYQNGQVWNAIQNRWQTAPVVVEFCPLYPDRKREVDLSGIPYPTEQQISEVQAAINQVKDYHVAYISNGNIASRFWYNPSQAIGGTNAEKWNAFSQTEKEKLFLLAKTAGYRFELQKVSVSQPIIHDQPFIVQAEWENSGVAPQYEPFDALYELRDASTNQIIWKSTPSQVNFETMLPSTQPQIVEDVFTVPTSVPAGTYNLYIHAIGREKSTDGTPYRQPLNLAIQGREADGGYKLGQVVVGSNVTATSLPEPTATLIPTSLPTLVPSVAPTNTIIPTLIPTAFVPSPTPDVRCPLQPRGDANCDKSIDDKDYQVWKNAFEGKPIRMVAQYSNPDFNADGKIDERDLEILKANMNAKNGGKKVN